MARTGNINFQIPVPTREDFTAAIAELRGNSNGSGGDLHITVEVKSDDGGKGAYEVHRSWFGEYDEAAKAYEFGDSVQQIVNALGKLEASLAKAGKTLDDFYEGAEARDRLYNKKTKDELGSTYPEELERYAEIAKAPEKYMNDIMYP